jgi:hypothetical protein
MSVFWPPETDTQFVLLPYEVSGPNSTMATPAQSLVTEYCATSGFEVLATEPVTVGFLAVEPPQASIVAPAISAAKRPNVFDKNECFIFFPPDPRLPNND